MGIIFTKAMNQEEMWYLAFQESTNIDLDAFATFWFVQTFNSLHSYMNLLD
jgi:hypothetical protein